MRPRRSPLDVVLTWIFLLLTLAAVVCYFVFPHDRSIFFICGGAAIFIRLMQYFMRFIN